MQHVLSANQFTKEDCERLFTIATRIKTSPWAYSHELTGRIMGSLFFEPSLRTRCSFEVAMNRLGGKVFSEGNATYSTSTAKGESFKDTLKTISQYVDVVVVRHPQEEIVAESANMSDVPVINGGDGMNEHPTQALLDLYTIKDAFENTEGLTVLFTGDLLCSRTIRSLLKLLKPYGTKNILARAMPPDLAYFENWSWIEEGQIEELLPTVDVVYMTRHQRERSLAREESRFVMTAKLAEKMKPTSVIMHPLPRTEELLEEVDNNHRAIYFQQAKNGMWVRMALLYSLLKERDWQ